MSQENLRGIGLMVAAMALFAVEDLFLKLAAARMATGQVILLAGLIGVAGFAPVVWWRGERLVAAGLLHPAVIARNAGEMIATVGYITALASVPLPTVSAVLQALPLGVTMAAALFLGEPVGWRRWSAILVGFAGVMLILRPGMDGFRPEALWVLPCVAGLVLRDLATRFIPADSSTVQVSAWGVASVAVLGAGMVVFQGAYEIPSGPHLLPILAAGVFGTFGYAAVVAATRHGDVAVVAPFRYTRLVFAILIAAAVLAEYPDRVTIAGSALIVLSGLYSFARERRKKAALSLKT
jgi:drug/metabolite transporter (DMT)-like permease